MYSRAEVSRSSNTTLDSEEFVFEFDEAILKNRGKQTGQYMGKVDPYRNFDHFARCSEYLSYDSDEYTLAKDREDRSPYFHISKDQSCDTVPPRTSLVSLPPPPLQSALQNDKPIDKNTPEQKIVVQEEMRTPLGGRNNLERRNEPHNRENRRENVLPKELTNGQVKYEEPMMVEGQMIHSPFNVSSIKKTNYSLRKSEGELLQMLTSLNSHGTSVSPYGGRKYSQILVTLPEENSKAVNQKQEKESHIAIQENKQMQPKQNQGQAKRNTNKTKSKSRRKQQKNNSRKATVSKQKQKVKQREILIQKQNQRKQAQKIQSRKRVTFNERGRIKLPSDSISHDELSAGLQPMKRQRPIQVLQEQPNEQYYAYVPQQQLKQQQIDPIPQPKQVENKTKKRKPQRVSVSKSKTKSKSIKKHSVPKSQTEDQQRVLGLQKGEVKRQVLKKKKQRENQVINLTPLSELSQGDWCSGKRFRVPPLSYWTCEKILEKKGKIFGVQRANEIFNCLHLDPYYILNPNTLVRLNCLEGKFTLRSKQRIDCPGFDAQSILTAGRLLHRKQLTISVHGRHAVDVQCTVDCRKPVDMQRPITIDHNEPFIIQNRGVHYVPVSLLLQ